MAATVAHCQQLIDKLRVLSVSDDAAKMEQVRLRRAVRGATAAMSCCGAAAAPTARLVRALWSAGRALRCLGSRSTRPRSSRCSEVKERTIEMVRSGVAVSPGMCEPW